MNHLRISKGIAFLLSLFLLGPIFLLPYAAEKQVSENENPSATLSLCAEEGSLALNCESAILMEQPERFCIHKTVTKHSLPHPSRKL